MSYLYCQECGNYLGSLGGDTCHCGWVNQDPPDFSPPAAQRPWVGLTDEEVLRVWLSPEAGKIPHCDRYLHYYRAIEAKLREKNT